MIGHVEYPLDKYHNNNSITLISNIYKRFDENIILFLVCHNLRWC